MTVFQSRLKELRKSKNVTQKKLGEYLGVTQTPPLPFVNAVAITFTKTKPTT